MSDEAAEIREVLGFFVGEDTTIMVKELLENDGSAARNTARQNDGTSEP